MCAYKLMGKSIQSCLLPAWVAWPTPSTTREELQMSECKKSDQTIKFGLLELKFSTPVKPVGYVEE